jgi:hypothetical protein
MADRHPKKSATVCFYYEKMPRQNAATALDTANRLS